MRCWVVFTFLVLFVAPVAAEPTAILSDDELDQVTAQGVVGLLFNISPQVVTNVVVVTPINVNTIVTTIPQVNTSVNTNDGGTFLTPSLGAITIIQPTIVENTVPSFLLPTTFQIQF